MSQVFTRLALATAVLLLSTAASAQQSCTRGKPVPNSSAATILFGWGMNGNSQLGAQRSGAIIVQTPSLLQVSSLATPRYSEVAAGAFHSFVLESNQSIAYGVGKGDDGETAGGPQSLGQVNNFNAVVQVVDGGQPAVLGTRTISGVAAGWYHSCFLVTSPLASAPNTLPYCSGKNDRGQLGTLNVTNAISLPTAVDVSGVLAGVQLTKIASGPDHNLALSSGGFLYAWGAGTSGELGNGANADSSLPVAVPLHVPIADIDCGYRFCLALSSSGDLYGWGLNDVSQLGGASTSATVGKPVKIVSGVTQFAAGGRHVLAVVNGKLMSWGSGTMGQTAQAKTIQSDIQAEWAVSAPTLIVAFAKVSIQSIAAGMKHSVVLDTCGNVYTFGSDAFGQLGVGRLLGSPQQFRSYSPLSVDFGARKMQPLLVFAGAFSTFLVAEVVA